MVQAVSVLLNLILLALTGLSLALWARILWTHRGSRRRELLDELVPPRRRRIPFWTIADVMLMIGAMILVNEALKRAMASRGWIPQVVPGEESAELTSDTLIAVIVAMSLSGLVGLTVTLAWMRLFDSDARRQIGLTCSWQDIKLGLRGALMILPPVMLISAAVNQLVPYEHPVLESLSQTATPAVFLATFVGTALVTPLVEEFLTRGLLQGCLQRIADPCDEADENPWYVRAFTPSFEATESCWRPRSFWPVLVSSLVFAGLHFGGQGAAPIPLFFLALGLGYLYRQTGSLTPSIVVHMVLNGLTLCVQFLNLLMS